MDLILILKYVTYGFICGNVCRVHQTPNFDLHQLPERPFRNMIIVTDMLFQTYTKRRTRTETKTLSFKVGQDILPELS